MGFRKAQRKQAKLKIGLSAPSGAGKTYSALLIAKGICGNWEEIAVIDTENGSAELYSDLGGYSVCGIKPPYTPKKYIDAISEAEEAGFKVLIIDSLSHAWSGEGGLLDMQDKATKSSKSGNSYTAWREVTPEHNKLVDAILQSNMDVIVTTRAKAEYVITENNGKKEIKKVGLAPVFRDGLEYELTVFLDLSQEHIASASKDRTGLFDRQNFIPTEETGKLLNTWRNGGAERHKCCICGKEISDKYFEQSMQKYGAAFCSGECKAEYEKAVNEEVDEREDKLSQITDDDLPFNMVG